MSLLFLAPAEGSNATLTFSNLDCLTVKSIQWGDGQTSTFQSGFAPSEPLPHIYEQPGNYTAQIAYVCTCCSDKITITRTATVEVCAGSASKPCLLLPASCVMLEKKGKEKLRRQ